MKKVILSTLILSMFLIFTSCGGGGNKKTQTAPEISNLQYSPQSVAMGAGGGAVMISGQIDYRDQEGNIDTATIISSQGTEIRPVYGIDGDIYGTIQGGYVADTTITGVFIFSMYVTDKTGLESNILFGTFTVY